MSVPYDGLKSVLSTLPDTFVLCEPTLNPVIPTGKHGLMYYVASIGRAEVAALGRFRVHTWNLAVISPVVGMEAASGPLLDAMHEVIDALEKSDTLTWTDATLEAFNDTLWCYSIQAQMYAEDVPDPVQEAQEEE